MGADGGGTARAFRGVAGDEGDVARLVALAGERHGGLDVIFANAGIGRGQRGSGAHKARPIAGFRARRHIVVHGRSLPQSLLAPGGRPRI